MYSRKKQLVVTSNDPIVDFETSIEGYNQFSIHSNDLDLIITLRKWTWSCTIHPISQFVFMEISTQFCVFATKLANHGIQKNVQEAMSMEPWKEAMKEEMRALEKKYMGNDESTNGENNSWMQMDFHYQI